MIGALWNGVSGIWQHDKGVSVESNNLANANTVGHKKDEINFSDLLYTDGGFGKGVKMQSISKQFEQGHIVRTGLSTDLALEGKGFFVVRSRENDGILYTRAGNFVQAKDGFLETQESFKVQGLLPQERIISTTNPLEVSFNDSFSKNIVSTNISNGKTKLYNINAKTTDYISSAKDDSILERGNNYKRKQNKINDIDLLKNEYINNLQNFSMNENTPEFKAVAQKSKIDFSDKLAFIREKDNKVSFNINGKNYSYSFDFKKDISDLQIDELYNFLDEEGRNKYLLINPKDIPSLEKLEDMKKAIPLQATIDAMPNTTAEEIEEKNKAQEQKNELENAYLEAKNKREQAYSNYLKASTFVELNKNLADKISSIAGFSSSSKSGFIEIESLILGKEFKVDEIKLNDEKLKSSIVQSAVKGSGLAMIDSLKEALKKAIERADSKYLEITNVLEYGDLNLVAENDINVRLDILNLSDKSVVELEISDDGFVFVKNNDNKFLVGRLSTVAFRNEQGLEPMGGNLYQKSKLSGNPFNADTMNVMRDKALEKSNVNYGNTLSHLMIYQRAFEASSKSITTSDEFLKTAIELVK